MNTFTELRRDIYQRFRAPVGRDLALADELLDPELLKIPVIVDFLAARRLSYEPDLSAISGLLHRCTENFYIRRYIADSLRRLDSPDLAAGVLQSAECPVETVLDIAGDAGIPVFSATTLESLVESLQSSRALISAFGYMASMPDTVFTPYLEAITRNARNRKLEQAAWYALSAANPSLAAEIARESSNRFGPFVQASNRNPMLLQTVFYGDPSQPGKGGSGGIGTLVMRLGNALANDGVVTCTPRIDSDTLSLPVQEEPEWGHTLYRFPVSLSESQPDQFLRNRPAIARAFGSTLDITGIQPKVVHVRFLDDASLAIVRESCRRNIPCALTLTPDPHRSLSLESGAIRRICSIGELMTLHRIWIGDELVRICRGWMAIGRNTMMDVVHQYFPQTERIKGHSIASVDEGVPAAATVIEIDFPFLLKAGAENVGGSRTSGRSEGLNEERLHAPLILSVGRLAPVKNTPALVQAWANGLWRTYNLVVIGGDWENPSAEELQELKAIRRALASAPPGAAGRSVFLSAQSARTIAELEAWLGKRTVRPYPDLYVAPSLKEEFGLAILEAMSAGMIACAPINGGAGTYIRSGVNGFLINTADAVSLKQDLETIIADLGQAPDRSEAIRTAARKTVSERYSIEAMARDYEAFYRKTIDDR